MSMWSLHLTFYSPVLTTLRFVSKRQLSVMDYFHPSCSLWFMFFSQLCWSTWYFDIKQTAIERFACFESLIYKYPFISLHFICVSTCTPFWHCNFFHPHTSYLSLNYTKNHINSNSYLFLICTPIWSHNLQFNFIYHTNIYTIFSSYTRVIPYGQSTNTILIHPDLSGPNRCVEVKLLTTKRTILITTFSFIFNITTRKTLNLLLP